MMSQLFSGDALRTYEMPSAVQCLAVSPDESWLAVGCSDDAFSAGSILAGDDLPMDQMADTIDVVMQAQLPVNPYNELNTVDETTDALDANNRTTDGSTGWRYYVNNAVTPTTVEIWANTDVEDGVIDEHLF